MKLFFQKGFVAFFLLMFLAVSAQAKAKGQAAPWQTLTSHPGRFRIQMPGSTDLDHTVKKSFVGPISSYVYKVDTDRGEEFSAEYVSIPSAALFFVGAKSILNRSKKGLLKDEEGTEIEFKEIPFENGEARELTYQAKDKDGSPLEGNAYFIIVKNNLYILTVTAPPGKLENTRIEQFFGSFEILPEE